VRRIDFELFVAARHESVREAVSQAGNARFVAAVVAV